jgi:hypothetical protein
VHAKRHQETSNKARPKINHRQIKRINQRLLKVKFQLVSQRDEK